VILLETSKQKLVFKVGEGEKSLLTTILQLYPRVTSSRVLSSGPSRPQTPIQQETQALLEESLQEQRNENKKLVKTFLAKHERFQKMDAAWKFCLTRTEADWLLQILNDIRVGSWIALGSPEAYREVVNENNAHDFWAMEIAGRFEAILLEALSGA